MKASILPVAVALFVACAAPTGNRLTYAEVQTLNPGVRAAWCLAEYPNGSVTRGPDGKVRTIVYRVSDPAGSNQELTLGFDGNEILCTKRYSGPVLRPVRTRPAPPPSAAPSPCAPPSPFPQAP